MKLEKLGRNRKKKIVIGVIVFLCFVSAIMFVGSRAKYRVTQSIPLVNGTINYKPYDFKMMAMYQANGSGGYTEIDTMPTSGYKINEEKSYCTTDNVNKDTTAKLYTDEKGQHVISNLKKNDKCYLWFDKEISKMTIPEMIASLNPTSGSTSFTGVSTTNEGLKSGTDDDGTTYYFRGNVTNNWVQFAGFYWRIIRINGDGSMRLIYNGTSATTTGTGTQISTSSYNTNYNDNAYVGYMYGTAGSSTYAATHANTNNSTIKGVLDNWYKTNIADKGYSNKISTEAGFCNDRKIYTGSSWTGFGTQGYGTNPTTYEPASRILKWSSGTNSWNTTQTPKFTCANKNADLFTASASSKGNKKLQYPVGLITMDEVIFGGGFAGFEAAANSSYYLYTNRSYWTMSPSYISKNGTIAYAFRVYSNGALYYSDYTGSDWDIYGDGVRDSDGVRPVINLSSDIQLKGSGTASDPYKVV